MASVQLLVSGKVQGVWYRKHACEKATEIGLTGTVRNLPNGDVCILAAGTVQQIEELEKWCWQGSPLSNVTDVRVISIDPLDAVGFSIVE